MKRFVSMLLVVVMCITCVPMTVNAQRDTSKEEILAQELKDLGLFRGVAETDFDLDRAPSRVEALVMLIRVLGKESEVTGDTWKHPFTDVPGWADNYVGYAYSKGLTNGQSATQFGTGDANAAMYLTFILRALGYSDTNGKDFAWDNPYTLSRETGILDNSVNINEFWRADVVIVSHKALSSYLNGSQQTLAQKLISAGVFTQREFDSIYNNGINVTKPTQSGELTAEEIFSKCSPAVFYIELYDKYDEAISSGSGFFIDDKGTAVTNYHVIEDAYSALIQLSDTEAVHEVLGVYDYNAEEDWAIIKIDCSGNKYLNIGDNSSVVGGAKVYAIGSPLGLQNTITEGIVSNPARVDGGVTYIQTNAAISHGSSGGALLNKYGEVIGITSAGYTEGQNLNLALPMSYLSDSETNDAVALSTLLSSNKPNIGGSRKDMAFSLLKEFVLENYQEYDKYSNWYSYIEEIDKSNNEGYETYELHYDAESDVLVVSVSDNYYWSHYFHYIFYIEHDQVDSYSGYYYNEYTDDEEYVCFANGTTWVDCAEFSEYYEYEFEEFEGDNQKDHENISMTMHDDGLFFVDYIFEEYLYEYGNYSVEDLGYLSWERFNFYRIDDDVSKPDMSAYEQLYEYILENGTSEDFLCAVFETIDSDNDIALAADIDEKIISLSLITDSYGNSGTLSIYLSEDSTEHFAYLVYELSGEEFCFSGTIDAETFNPARPRVYDFDTDIYSDLYDTGKQLFEAVITNALLNAHIVFDDSPVSLSDFGFINF